MMSTTFYADLMFAWGHARLGEAAQARALADPAIKTLTATGDAAHAWAAAAFQYRIDQALAGRPHAGGWPRHLVDRLNHLDDHGVPPSRRYVVARLRQWYRIVVPDRRPNPYAGYLRLGAKDWLGRAIDGMEVARGPEEFSRQFHEIMRRVGRSNRVEPLARVLATAANGGDRVSPEDTDTIFEKTVGLVGRCLRGMPATPTEREAVRDLVGRVFDLGVSRRDNEAVRTLGAQLVDWARLGTHDAGRVTAASLFAGLVPALYRLGMAEELASLLDIIDETGAPVGRSAVDADVATQLLVAGCDLWLGQTTAAEKVLEAVRSALAAGASGRPCPNVVVRLAAGYARAAGMAPVAVGGPLLLDLVRGLPRVPNRFTTATHFSRLHLDVVEAAVLAAATEDFGSPPALAARLGAVEVDDRRALLPDLRSAIVGWASPAWNCIGTAVAGVAAC